MKSMVFQLLSCFIFNKTKRRNFRQKHIVKQKIKNSGKDNIISAPSNRNISISVIGDRNNIYIDKDIDVESEISISLVGNDNSIKIQPGIHRMYVAMCVNDGRSVNGCSFSIGKNSRSTGVTQYFMLEDDTHISIGDDCMFSSDISFRCTDDHAVIDIENNRVINKANRIDIGNHVWICMKACILKNSKVSDNCIVGMGTVVAGKFEKPHCAIAGNPARIIKENITWDEKRPTDVILDQHTV